MTVSIEEALKSIGLHVFDYYFDSSKKYKNSKGEYVEIDEYITYQTIIETPLTYADDVDEYTVKQIDVDLFTQSHINLNKYKLKIRDALRISGYTITDTLVQYESDSRYWHLTITVSTIEITETEKGA
ncbi:MAG: hypothetical protein KBT27_13245 [Prevotellaceae bacterium]|nr:hypothetical protein [Candidatus Faecinaster equi]